MPLRTYATHRMHLIFESGPLFYAEYNMRLFLLLLLRKKDLLVSNDLDTLLPNFIISKWWRLPLVYDSHEYFTEVPELVSRPRIQKIWKSIEQAIFPRLTDVFTVNDSIADLFEKDYGLRPKVLRNIPSAQEVTRSMTRAELNLPEDKRILILQGSGINIQRGAEEMVEAMQFIDHALLLIIGSGDVIDLLKEKVAILNIGDRVMIKPRLPYELMMQHTVHADLGLTLDKDSNLNYRFSLPNKLFDYIHAGIPVISSALPEIEKIIKTYDIGDFIPDHDPRHMADKINESLANQAVMDRWKKNTNLAAQKLSWETEEIILKEVYSNYV